MAGFLFVGWFFWSFSLKNWDIGKYLKFVNGKLNEISFSFVDALVTGVM